jgi:hypothetical protein
VRNYIHIEALLPGIAIKQFMKAAG